MCHAACSIGVFRYLVAPAVRHLLEAGLRSRVTAAPIDWLLGSFELLYNALWLFPAYVISLVVNTLWCDSHDTQPSLIKATTRPATVPHNVDGSALPYTA